MRIQCPSFYLVSANARFILNVAWSTLRASQPHWPKAYQKPALLKGCVKMKSVAFFYVVYLLKLFHSQCWYIFWCWERLRSSWLRQSEFKLSLTMQVIMSESKTCWILLTMHIYVVSPTLMWHSGKRSHKTGYDLDVSTQDFPKYSWPMFTRHRWSLQPLTNQRHAMPGGRGQHMRGNDIKFNA